MKVAEVMTAKVITVSPEASYLEVARLLVKHKISSVPVVDNNQKLIGIVSEKDLLRIMYPFYSSYMEHPEIYTNLEEREDKIVDIAKHQVSRFMTDAVVTIGPEAPILEAGAKMIAKRVNRLPVVENGQLIGIVARRDIYHHIFKEHFFKKRKKKI